MSDDLVKRLRDLGDHASFEPHMHHTAADRIEELSNCVAVLEAKLSKCEALLAQQDDLIKERSDEVQAAVAAALREAAGIARASFDGEIGYDEILDLITPDAQAALDRVVAAEREWCAELAESHKPSASFISERYWRGVDEAAHSIAAAIREGRE